MNNFSWSECWQSKTYAWDRIVSCVPWEMVGAIATVFALLLALPAFFRAMREMRDLAKKVDLGGYARRRLDKIRAMADGGAEAIWSQPLDMRKHLKEAEGSIPVLMFAHLKGGVGKTTVAANLAAAFSTRGKRVLAIDLDYQGSLSSLFLGHAGITDDQLLEEAQARAALLIEGERDGAFLLSAARETGAEDLQRLRYIPSSYTLADVENRETIRWMIGETTGETDPRLHLAKLIWSTPVQEAFDLIIIDTAPRLTFAFINGLCSATHVVTPTIMDGMSANAVNDMMRQLVLLKRRLTLSFEMTGVVPNNTFNWDQLTAREQNAASRIKRDVMKTLGRGDILYDDAIIRRDVVIQEAAGNKLAYFQSVDARRGFDRLADKIAERIGL